MDDAEFLLHMQIIRDMLKHKHVRIILLHPPYSDSQQVIIDAICRHSTKIIGQLERKPPIIDAAKEVERLILAHKDPFIPVDQLQYVIIGQQKPKNLGGRVSPTSSSS